MRHGKAYRNARAQIDREQLYSPVEAVKLLKDAETAKFDESVEAHFNLGLNVRHAEQQLRGTLMLPHGTGRETKVAVFAEGDKAREAEEAGADVVGTNDLAAKIEEGFDDFDVAIATPDQMGVVGKLGRILGPRGKMPNPKTGTVTMDLAQGRPRLEGRQARVPHRPRRERPRHDRQEELRRAPAARELRGADRRDHAREALRCERPLHQDGYTDQHDGPGDPRRSGADEGHRRRARGSTARRRSSTRVEISRPRPLAAARRKSSAGGAKGRPRASPSPPECGLVS